MSDINDRLMQAKERLRKKRKLDSMLHGQQAMLKEEQHQCRRHEQVLAAERADVQQLEGFSLTGLFYSILGTKEERLERERQEHLAARLKHEACTAAVSEIQQEIERLQRELTAYTEAQDEYERLIEEKRQLIDSAADGRAEKLIDVSERLADLEADQKEIQEAVRAGETAERALRKVQRELQSAENWGTWDLLGGGSMVTLAKHSQIDSAKQQARVAQRHLRQFQEELADADQRLHVSLGEIGGFSTFADFFFDGMIADWVVQSKVQNASEACVSAIRNVAAALNECRRRLSETEQQIEQVANERREFVERA